ncbi:unnamed protein product [Lactuca saligna]|uniref:Uncharacterized protein n=1 Tax=Lactuca saligna TaxID=75948 RepID=A0AA35ZXK4_LACSI|nr:unnamed protein product [Lactuca saligna]
MSGQCLGLVSSTRVVSPSSTSPASNQKCFSPILSYPSPTPPSFAHETTPEKSKHKIDSSLSFSTSFLSSKFSMKDSKFSGKFLSEGEGSNEALNWTNFTLFLMFIDIYNFQHYLKRVMAPAKRLEQLEGLLELNSVTLRKVNSVLICNQIPVWNGYAD